MNIEEKVIESRLQMIKLFGSNIQDSITSFHFDPKTNETSMGITAIDNSLGNDMKGLAQVLREDPYQIIGCSSDDSTSLVKLIMHRFSPSNGFDVHHYFEYDTPFSKSSVNSLIVYPDGRLALLSDRMRIGTLGF